MRSRSARWAVAAIALGVIAAAGFFVLHSDKQIAAARAAGRSFDLHAREAAARVSDVRAAEQAYVARGQGVAFWTSRVSEIVTTLGGAVSALQQSATSAGAHAALDEVAASLVEFESVDKRAREYLRAEQAFMAGDVIFTDGLQASDKVARGVEAARLAERDAVDSLDAATHTRQVLVAGAAAIVVLLVVVLLGMPHEATRPEVRAGAAPEAPAERARRPEPPLARPDVSALKNAAELCTGFGQVRSLDDLQALVGRMAEVMGASGLVVWLGDAAGADLRPVLAHGYPPQALGKMPSVPRAADNAAATAYRSGSLQVVRAQPGSPTGAVVAPILSADGCIGALSAETKTGTESSETVQTLAVIFAAQLASVLGSAQPAAVVEERTAASS